MKDSKPNFNLIHPRCVYWRVVKVEPVAVALIEVDPTGPMVNIQIIPNDVDRSTDFRGQVIHESLQVIARAKYGHCRSRIPFYADH